MSNASTNFFNAIRKSAITLAVAGVLASVGCSTTEYAYAGERGPALQRGSAPHAWKELKDGEDLGKTIGFLGRIAGGDVQRLGTVVGQTLQDARREAQAEANNALRSPLPGQALKSMADEASRDLVVAIPNIPSIRESPRRQIIAFPELLNTSGATDPNLSILFDQIRSNVFQNEAMTANLVFVQSTERDADKIIASVAGSKTEVFRDPLQRTADRTTAVTYDPETIHLTSGTLSCVVDHVNYTVDATFTVTVSHVRTRKTEWTRQYNRKYMWHPKLHRWELQDGDALLASR